MLVAVRHDGRLLSLACACVGGGWGGGDEMKKSFAWRALRFVLVVVGKLANLHADSNDFTERYVRQSVQRNFYDISVELERMKKMTQFCSRFFHSVNLNVFAKTRNTLPRRDSMLTMCVLA